MPLGGPFGKGRFYAFAATSQPLKW
jgi:hypothetical protein